MIRVNRLVMSALAGLVTSSLLLTINLLAAARTQNVVPSGIEKVKVQVQATSAALARAIT
jgi:hypothetical protein